MQAAQQSKLLVVVVYSSFTVRVAREARRRVPADLPVPVCHDHQIHSPVGSMPLAARSPPLHRLRPLPGATAGILPRSASAVESQRRHLPLSPRVRVRVRASNSDPPQQQVNLSVLRFTLGTAPSASHLPAAAAAAELAALTTLRSDAGIPGLDESYLPRWIGLGFGALVLLNHLLSPSPTPAQLVEGADAARRVPLPEGSRQVFVMSENLSAAQKEDMAWASYVLLRNTNTTSVLIAVGNMLCVRGYWDPPADTSKYATIEWFRSQMQQVGLVDLRDALYFSNISDSQLGKILPDGVLSVLAQPVLNSPAPATGAVKTEGVILLASNANYAYNEKDRVWIRTVANKFQHT
ncbi:hypothetical protein ACP70R_019514 [Stipagrostis hirtigluma subsp. patula]